MASEATEAAGDGGGIDGKKLALGAVVVLGVVLVLRALRGGDGDEDEDEDDLDLDLDTDESAGDATDTTDIVGGTESGDGGMPVDADVQGRFDEIDIVDAVYILVAGLKAAREEYRKRTDEGGA